VNSGAAIAAFCSNSDKYLELGERRTVTLPYDIFRKLPEGESIWIEAVQSLELAQARLATLTKNQPGDYILYDLSRRLIISPAA
jgi:hypothetical protein